MSLAITEMASFPTFAAALLLAVVMGYGDQPGSDSVSLFEFDRDEAEEWLIINDGVMGGVSSSRFASSDSGFATFSGELSLENNGGFASVRAALAEGALESRESLILRVRGDGRTYQVRLRTDRRIDGISYMARFETAKNEWQEVRLPLDRFQPTFRGRRPAGAPPLAPAAVQQIGLLLADGTPGEFRLDVAWIRAR